MAGLRAVKAGDKTGVPVKVKSVDQAAAGGDHKELLMAMRERIAAAVSDPGCPPRDLAALTRRLQDISKEIDSIRLREKQERTEDGVGGEDEAWDSEAL